MIVQFFVCDVPSPLPPVPPVSIKFYGVCCDYTKFYGVCCDYTKKCKIIVELCVIILLVKKITQPVKLNHQTK